MSRFAKISESGVRRLMQSYLQSGTEDSFFPGATAAGNLPMVVPLTGAESAYPKRYFMDDMGFSEEDAEAEVSKFSSWYGIVEGCHRNESLRRLACQYPQSFVSFTWTVLLLKPAPLQKLRAFARNIVEKQRSRFTIASTLYDSLFSLREDYRSLTAHSSSDSISITALCCFATGSKRPQSEAMRVLARKAISLSDETIEKLGDLLNAEEPEIAYSRAPKNTPIDTLDCRVFRKVLMINTFRTARAFFLTQMIPSLRRTKLLPLSDSSNSPERTTTRRVQVQSLMRYTSVQGKPRQKCQSSLRFLKENIGLCLYKQFEKICFTRPFLTMRFL